MKQLLIITIAITVFSCGNLNKVKMSEEKVKNTTSIYPKASDFVKSPVRNRLILELDKSVPEVYALVGDPGNMSEYSAGLERVETKMKNGKCISYTCYFKPMAEGEEGLVHTDSVVWQETNLGWASKEDGVSEFGFTEMFSLTTLEDKGSKTLLKWYMHYDNENLKMLTMNKTTLVEVFDDMGKQLTSKFGGKVVENYKEPQQK